ncbi:MAG: hypothetical protein PHD56_02760 [Anaerostipes sp.]|nr:hypothetical protein [Anaerostipes sp.]
MKKQEEFLEVLDQEIESRIKTIEASDYEGVPEFNKTDGILSAVTIVVCIGILIFTYNFLC